MSHRSEFFSLSLSLCDTYICCLWSNQCILKNKTEVLYLFQPFGFHWFTIFAYRRA